ncbi:MAG TPA: hypothetical protein VMV86_05800 [Methanosarcinales archaeon]|nr:hypothetical protein [Methanosarcinales archaeon]
MKQLDKILIYHPNGYIEEYDYRQMTCSCPGERHNLKITFPIFEFPQNLQDMMAILSKSTFGHLYLVNPSQGYMQ